MCSVHSCYVHLVATGNGLATLIMKECAKVCIMLTFGVKRQSDFFVLNPTIECP